MFKKYMADILPDRLTTCQSERKSVVSRRPSVNEFLFFCRTQKYTNQLAYISLCITEFIGHTISLHALAHGAIIRRYVNKPYTIELCFLYSSIYCVYLT
jgi:hypothetical protein